MNNSDITILWATQSGRAKACARRTIRLLQSKQQQSSSSDNKLNFHGCCSFDEYNFLSLCQQSAVQQSNDDEHQTQPTKKKHTLLLLFVSTTGDAEQPNNMTQTWNLLLSKSLSPTFYSNISFALFALGDRSYGPQAFCAAGRKLATRLVQLGALPICQIGYGDDGSLNGGVFADLDVWLEKELFPSVIAAKPMSSGMSSSTQNGTSDISGSINMMTDGQDNSLSTSPYQVTVQSNDHDSSVSNKHDIEEWQRKEYQQSYSKYFAQLCPATSYQYNDQLERLETSTSSNGSDNPPLLGCVTVNERITSEDWIQDTRHIRIRVTDAMIGNDDDNSNISSQQQHHNSLPYQAGDVATILPSNPSSLVERFISLLPVSIRSVADATLHITYNPNQSSTTIMNHPWPTTCSLRGLLTYCADIQSLPEREDLYALSSYCNTTKQHVNGQDQQDKLISLSETSGASLYGDYIIREKRNWVDVLYDFDSISSSVLLGIGELLMILPSMMPRHFSIASSPSYMKQQQQQQQQLVGSGSDKEAAGFELELCVAVVEGSTPLGRLYTGCCSKYLASLVPNKPTTTKDDKEGELGGSAVRLWIHPGSFSKLPLNPRTAEDGEQRNNLPSRQFEIPILCIGAGTGIAPLRSLILEREAHIGKVLPSSHSSAGDELVNNTTTTNTDNDMDNVLIFGCRKKTKDYYYGSEWETLTNNNRLRLIPAFSRDQKHKLYVQRALREASGGELIVRHMLERHGAVYVAGGSKMARAVKDEIVEALTNRLDGGEKDAKRLLNKMKRKGLFSIEAWS